MATPNPFTALVAVVPNCREFEHGGIVDNRLEMQSSRVASSSLEARCTYEVERRK